MKRSTGIALVLTCSVAALAGGPLLIEHFRAAPQVDADQPEELFQSVDECTTRYDRTDCETKSAEAQKTYDATVPHYATRTECEAEYGAGFCDERPPAGAGAASIFLPAMVGFVAGAALAGAATPLHYVPLREIPPGAAPGGLDCASDAMARQQDACRQQRPMTSNTGSGSHYFYRTATGSGGTGSTVTGARPGPATVARGSSVESARSAAAHASSRSGSVSRGGFGGSASAHSGAGE